MDEIESPAAHPAFDYAKIENSVRPAVLQKTQEIRDRVGRAAQSVFEIGERLVAIREMIPRGHFVDWLDAEFGWSERSAYNMMQVAETFKFATFAKLSVGASALYALANPSTPENVREEMVREGNSGAKITHKKVKAAIAAANPAPVAPDPPKDPVGARLIRETKSAAEAAIAAEPEEWDDPSFGDDEMEPEEAKPWAEFEAGIDAVCSLLRSASRKLAGILEYDAATKQLRNRWARGYSHSGTIGAVNMLIRCLEHGLPARVVPEPPGYIVVSVAKSRDAFLNRK